jgi:dynactin complex subunit
MNYELNTVMQNGYQWACNELNTLNDALTRMQHESNIALERLRMQVTELTAALSEEVENTLSYQDTIEEIEEALELGKITGSVGSTIVGEIKHLMASAS